MKKNQKFSRKEELRVAKISLWNLKQGFSEEDVFTFFCPFHPIQSFCTWNDWNKKIRALIRTKANRRKK
jgi:hypothetical protein